MILIGNKLHLGRHKEVLGHPLDDLGQPYNQQ